MFVADKIKKRGREESKINVGDGQDQEQRQRGIEDQCWWRARSRREVERNRRSMLVAGKIKKRGREESKINVGGGQDQEERQRGIKEQE